MTTKKPTVAVYKFSSCDGCQLQLLNMEDDLLDLANAIDIAYFLEATRTEKPGPYDIAIVEGSITTPHEIERIKEVRANAKIVIALGTCATAGGIQSLRNFANADEYSRYVAYFQSPGYAAASGGMFLNREYGHIALPHAGVLLPPLVLLAILLAGRFPEPAPGVSCRTSSSGA